MTESANMDKNNASPIRCQLLAPIIGTPANEETDFHLPYLS